MTIKTVGEETLNNPKNVQATCKTCGFMFFGASQLIDHLDAHN